MQNLSHNQIICRLGEDAAKKLYEESGFKILVRNFYNPRGKKRGEIDFIAVKNNHLHFVEVKTRTNKRFGEIIEAISVLKKARIVLTAKFFLMNFKHFSNYNLHIDVASVEVNLFDKTVKKIRINSDAIEGNY
jgi:putative endonuclease